MTWGLSVTHTQHKMCVRTYIHTYMHTQYTNTHTYLLTYLLTPGCRVSLEKLTVLQLVKKFPAFHRTRRFITALTSVRQLSLSWASPIQSIYPHPTSWRSILIFSTYLRLGLPVVSFTPVSPARPYTPPSPHPYAPHAQPISFFSILSPAQYWVRSRNHLAPRHIHTHMLISKILVRKIKVSKHFKQIFCVLGNPHGVYFVYRYQLTYLEPGGASTRLAIPFTTL